MLTKRQPYRNKKITQAARDEPCLANFPGCTGGGEDTVFCHLNANYAGKGMGQKADDCAGFFGCSSCHDLYDGRRWLPTKDERNEWTFEQYGYLLQAYYKTIRRLIDKGVIK